MADNKKTDKAAELDLSAMSVEGLLNLQQRIKAELQSAYDQKEAELIEMRKVLGMDEETTERSSGGKRTRASAEEVEARKQSVLDALKNTSKGKGLSKSQLADKAGLDVAQAQQAINKLKADKAIKMEGNRANATYFLA